MMSFKLQTTNFQSFWKAFIARICILVLLFASLFVEDAVEASSTITNLNFFRIGADGETLANSSLIAEIQDTFGGTSNGRPFTSSSCAAVCAKHANCTAYSVAITAGGKSSCKIAADSSARVPMIGSRVYKKVMNTQLDGQACTVNAECLGHPLMTCEGTLCLCPMAYVASLNLSECLPVRSIGDVCLEHVQCPFDCLGGICTCNDTSAEAVTLIPGPNDVRTCVDANTTQIDVSSSLPYNLSYPFPRENYTDDLDLSWCIEASPAATGLTITVTFWDVEPWYDGVRILSNCTSEKTRIHSFWQDSNSGGDPMTATWLEPTTVTTSTGNHVGVQFTTDGSVTMTGFTILFTAP